ncbi:PKD domain-containing protein [uncultured Microscilla sp.]|uniref:PKD domain-containing protein n=1 Tax=uncultured Microscilla sp. TaxID=432653 RepID=UPI002613D928|nr:PKD domain-containing protein [uncultured Microscilla sp.]
MNYRSTLSLLFGGLLLGLVGCLQVQEIPFIELQSRFSFVQSTVQVGDTVKFSQNSSTVASQFLWDFGDNKTSTEPSPLHTYDSIGNFTVKLIATKPDGITKDSSTQTIKVLPATATPKEAATFGLASDDEVGFNFTPATDNSGTILMAKKNVNVLQLRKIDNSGNELWVRDFNNLADGQVYGQRISPTNDGGFVVVGYIEDSPTENDAFVLKVNKDGELQWQKVVATELNESFNDVVDLNGNLIVVGSSQVVGGQSSIQFEVYDTQNGILLDKQEISSANWTVSSLEITQDGGFVVVGFEDDAPLIVKFDPSLKIQWNTTLSIKGKAKAVTQSDNRDFIFVGETTDGDTTHAFVARVNQAGTLIWLKTMELSKESFSDVEEDSNKDIIVLGTHENILTSKDMIIAKYNAQGDLKQVKLIGGKEEDEGNKLAINPGDNNRLVLIGSTESFGTKNNRKDIFIVFLDSSLE